jgi:excisionase family DNA binding protein
MGDLLTTTQAAKRARTSRPTVSRALKNGDLIGQRGNDSRWLIKVEDLDSWNAQRSSVHDEHRSMTVHEHKKSNENEQLNALSLQLKAAKIENAETREKLARVEGESTANRERITDLINERDRLLSLLEARPVGFFSRLFNR